MTRTTLDVTGMACDGCEATVTERLETIDGVSAVVADHEADEVRVDHDGETSTATIRKAIGDAGYEVVA